MQILLAFCLATFAMALSPGPDNIFVLTLSITRGYKAGLWVVMGLMAGCLIHTGLVALGMATIIKQSPLLFRTIQWAGAGYLFFLAYKVWRAPSQIHLTQTQEATSSSGALFKTGFIMNLLNPKVAIFFLAFFPGFLFSENLNPGLQFIFLGILFILISFLVFGSIALLAGLLADTFNHYPKMGIFFKYLQIVVFISIALFLIYQ